MYAQRSRRLPVTTRGRKRLALFCRFSAIPHFFLHIRDGDELIKSLDGSDLPDLDAACAEALAGARDVLAERLRAGEALDGQKIEITDKTGKLLAVVPLKDAIRLS